MKAHLAVSIRGLPCIIHRSLERNMKMDPVALHLIVIVGLYFIPVARNEAYDLRNIRYCGEGLRNV